MNDYVVATTVDSSGNLYVVGVTYSGATGTGEALVQKYYASGGLSWTEAWSGPNNQDSQGSDNAAATGVAVDPSGNYLYVSGYVDASWSTFLGMTNLASADTFFMKLSTANGSPVSSQWPVMVGGGSFTYIFAGAMALSQTGSEAYVAADYINSNSGVSDLALLALSTVDGSITWQSGWQAQGELAPLTCNSLPVIPTSVVVSSTGTVYVGGAAQQSNGNNICVTFTWDGMVAAFSSNGAWLWTNSMGDNSAITSLTMSSNNLVAVGVFETPICNINFPDNPDDTNPLPNEADILLDAICAGELPNSFIASFSSSSAGASNWGLSILAKNGPELPTSVVTAPNGDIYAAGSTPSNNAFIAEYRTSGSSEARAALNDLLTGARGPAGASISLTPGSADGTPLYVSTSVIGSGTVAGRNDGTPLSGYGIRFGSARGFGISTSQGFGITSQGTNGGSWIQDETIEDVHGGYDIASVVLGAPTSVSFTNNGFGKGSPSGTANYFAGLTVQLQATTTSNNNPFGYWNTSTGATVIACNICSTTTSLITGADTVTAEFISFSTSPSTGTYGTKIALTGLGFAPSHNYIYCLTTSVTCPPNSPYFSTTNGRIPSGTNLIVANVGSLSPNFLLIFGSQVLFKTSFSVMVPSGFASPGQGAVGTITYLIEDGLNTNTVYGACLYAATGCDKLDKSGTFTTGSNGAPTGSVPLTVSDSAVTGILIYLNGQNVAIDPYQVTTPSLTLSTNGVLAGTVVGLSGSGYATNANNNPQYKACMSSSSGACIGSSTTFSPSSGAIPSGVQLTAVLGATQVIVTFSGNLVLSTAFAVLPPDLTLSVSSGPVGTPITLSGAGFGLSTSYTACVVVAAGVCDQAARSVSVTASSSGTFSSIHLAISSTSEVAVDILSGSQIVASAYITVTPSHFSISPVSGAIGTEITLVGSQLAPGVSYDVCVLVGGQCTFYKNLFTTNSMGQIPGTTLQITETSSAIVELQFGNNVPATMNSATFTLTTPSVTISPNHGQLGTPVMFTGQGFAKLTQYTALLCSSPTYSVASCGAATSQTFTTDKNGVITTSVVVTVASYGTAYAMIVLASTDTVVVDLPFTVVAPTISATPPLGPVYTPITISSAGLMDSQSYSVCLASASGCITTLQSFTSSSTGTFSGIVIDAIASVTQVDLYQSGTLVTSTSFQVTNPSLTAAPNTGPADTTVNLSGSQYAPSSSYTACFSISLITCTGNSFPVHSNGAGTLYESPYVIIPTGAPTGANYIVVFAQAGAVAWTTFTVTNPQFTFSLSLSSPGSTVQPGDSASPTATMTTTQGSPVSVTLTETPTPPNGLTITFSPGSSCDPTPTSCIVTINFVTNGHIAPGFYPFVISATAGSQVDTAKYNLTVNITTQLGLSATTQNLVVGQSVLFAATINEGPGTSGIGGLTINFYAGGGLAGTAVTLSNGTALFLWTPSSGGDNLAFATFSGNAQYAASASNTFEVNVFDFVITLSPASGSVLQGGNAQTTLSVGLVGGSGTITGFGASGLPHGVTALFSPTTCSSLPCSSTLTFAAGVGAPQGTYTITVTAFDGSLSHSATYTLTVSSAGNQVTFFESGLSSGTTWSATINGIGTMSSSGPTIVFSNVAAGSYTWSVTPSFSCGSGCEQDASPASGSVTVTGSTVVSITYNGLYEVTFVSNPSAGGSTSPSGSIWYAAGANVPISEATTSGWAFQLWDPGSSSLSLICSSCASTTLIVNGPGTLAADFGQVSDTVTFSESGLPAYTVWTVTFDGTPYTSAASQIYVVVFPGTYSWSATPTLSCGSGCQYEAEISSGTVTVSGSTSVGVTYLQQYQVTFTSSPSAGGESAPSGTYWLNAGSTESISAINYLNYVFQLWTSDNPALSIACYGCASTTVTIAGSGTVTADFGQVEYSVTFAESGLPQYTVWTLNFEGSPYTSGYYAITLPVYSGTYSWGADSVSCGTGCEYDPSPASGSVTVSGGTVTVNIVYNLSGAAAKNPSNGSAFSWLALFQAVPAPAILARSSAPRKSSLKTGTPHRGNRKNRLAQKGISPF